MEPTAAQLSPEEASYVLACANSVQVDHDQLGISLDDEILWIDGEKLRVEGVISPKDNARFFFAASGTHIEARRPKTREVLWSATADTPLTFYLQEDTMAKDSVNHPAHYARGWSNDAEVIDITENLSFNLGNVVKYAARAGKKHPSKTIEDLEKASWYLNREIARLTKGGQA